MQNIEELATKDRFREGLLFKKSKKVWTEKYFVLEVSEPQGTRIDWGGMGPGGRSVIGLAL